MTNKAIRKKEKGKEREKHNKVQRNGEMKEITMKKLQRSTTKRRQKSKIENRKNQNLKTKEIEKDTGKEEQMNQ